METEGSDNEFWNDIEIVKDKLNAPGINQFSMNLAESITNKIDQRTMRPVVFTEKLERNSREFYEDKIERVRESKDEEAKMMLIKTKNVIRREFEDVVRRNKEKYEKIISELKIELFRLREVLQSRDISINHLCNTIAEMELSTIKARIHQIKKKFKFQNPSEPSQIGEYTSHINNLNLQISSLKETCSIYKQELDKINDFKQEYKDKLSKKELALRHELEKMSQSLKSKDHECESKIKKIQHEFDKYKKDANLEQAAREILVDRQKHQINSLKDELRNAKIVLQSKKLRQKFYERLDDYMKEIKTPHKKTKSEMPSRNSSMKFKTEDLSGKNKKKSQKSELSSPNSRIYSRKVSSPHCFTVDFTVTNSFYP